MPESLDQLTVTILNRFVYAKSTFFALVHIEMSRIVLILFVLLCFCLMSVGLNYTGWINLGNFCYLWVAYRIIECVTNGKSGVGGIEIGKELRHISIFFKTKSCCMWQKHLPKRIRTTIPTPTLPGSSMSHVYANVVIVDRRARPTLDEIIPIQTDGNSNRQDMPYEVSFYGQPISSFLYFLFVLRMVHAKIYTR